MVENVTANPCPAPDAWDNMPTSNNVLVLQDADPGNHLIKYYTKSTTDNNPSGGIPGFKEVCIASSATPLSANSLWTILGESWGAGITNKNVVEFNGHRNGATPGASGEKYNIPFDGNAYEVGTIQWNNVQSNIKTLSHINSPECLRVQDNDNDQNPNTCFVRPPNPPGVVPELATIVLTSTGILGLIAMSRKYRNK